MKTLASSFAAASSLAFFLKCSWFLLYTHLESRWSIQLPCIFAHQCTLLKKLTTFWEWGLAIVKKNCLEQNVVTQTVDSGLFWRNPFLNWDLMVLNDTQAVGADGKWLGDYYFLLGKWVTFQGLWKTRGGWLRFGWIVQNPQWFSRCPVLWALSHNLPPLVVVVRAPLLQFEVPQIYAVFRMWLAHPPNIQTQWDVTSCFIVDHILRQWPPRSDEFCCTSLWCRPWMRGYIHITFRSPKPYGANTLSLGKAQTMSCIWA